MGGQTSQSPSSSAPKPRERARPLISLSSTILTQINDEPAGAQTADTTGELVTDISNSYGAIGYTGSSFVLNHAQTGKIFPICIDGFGATKDNINSGKYTFWNIEHAYTKGTVDPLTAAFLGYIQSTAFQNADLASLGFLKVDELSSAAKATHPIPPPPSGP